MKARRSVSVSCAGVLLTSGLSLGLLNISNVSTGAAVPTAKNVYVANTAGLPATAPQYVAQYSVGAGDSLSPLTPATVTAGTVPVEMGVTPNGANVYVVSFSDVVSQYTVDPTSGALAPMTPATVATGSIPTAISISPNGHNAYVTNDGNNDVSQYAINPITGALAPLSPPTVSAGDEPSDVVVSPDGGTAYVTNASDNTIWQYDVNPVTGALSPMSPPSVLGGGGPRAIVLTPDGTHAYVTNSNEGDNDVSQFNVSPLTGELTPMTPATVAAGPQPEGIALNPDGTSAYVANVAGGGANPGGGSISQYNVDPVTGALSPKTPASVPSPNPIDVVVAPDGGIAYVTNYVASGTISEYDIDPTSGLLSLRTTVPSEGAYPEGISVRSVPSAVAPATAVVIPSNGAALRGNVVLDASASAGLGVVKVQFVLTGGSYNKSVIGTATPTIYGYINLWNTTGVPGGTYTLQSIVTDNDGNTAYGTGITITVDNTPPTTAVLIPSNGAHLKGIVVLDASAAASYGVKITKVQFVLTGRSFNKTVIGTATATIFGWVFVGNTTLVHNGTYRLQSLATDAAGNTAYSQGTTIKVAN